MPLSPEALEQQEKEALRKWASSKYAVSNGYPIPEWRRGIKWYAPGSGRDLPKKVGDRTKPAIVGFATFVDECEDGDLLISYRSEGSGIICKMGRDHEVKWEWGRGEMGNSTRNAAVRNWNTGNVLISDVANSRILEYDPSADQVNFEITEFSGVGSFDSPRATYELGSGQEVAQERPYPKYTGNVNVADFMNHYVAILDDAGAVQQSFGTYGTSGDGTDLRRPYWLWGNESYYFIADCRNNRVIRGTDMAGDAVDFLVAWPYPTSVRNLHLVTISSEHFRPLAFTGDGLHSFLPFVSEHCLTRNFWGGGLSLSGTYHGSAFEIDLRSAPELGQPMMWPNVTGETANTELYVIPCLGFERVVVEALSSAADTLHLYSLKTRGGHDENPPMAEADASGNLQWQEFKTKGLTADELYRYAMTSPYGVQAVQVTGSGSVDLRVHYEPG